MLSVLPKEMASQTKMFEREDKLEKNKAKCHNY